MPPMYAEPIVLDCFAKPYRLEGLAALCYRSGGAQCHIKFLVFLRNCCFSPWRVLRSTISPPSLRKDFTFLTSVVLSPSAFAAAKALVRGEEPDSSELSTQVGKAEVFMAWSVDWRCER